MHLSKIGPAFGYHVNRQKTWLITTDYLSSPAAEIFGDSSVNITTDSRPVLGSPVGKPEYITEFVSQKVQQWVGEIDKLSDIADSQPHAARFVYSKWSYLSRTTPNIDHLL